MLSKHVPTSSDSSTQKFKSRKQFRQLLLSLRGPDKLADGQIDGLTDSVLKWPSALSGLQRNEATLVCIPFPEYARLRHRYVHWEKPWIDDRLSSKLSTNKLIFKSYL